MSTHTKIKQIRLKLHSKDTGYKKEVLLKQYQLPNGLVETFFVDEGKDSVQIFALTEDNKVLAVKQFRAGPEKLIVELPGGGMELGEDPVEAGLRELKEETGFVSSHAINLGKFPYSPFSTGYRHGIMATGCKKVSGLDLDPTEFIQVVEIPIEEFHEHMKKGSVRGFELAYMGLHNLGLLELKKL